MNARNFIVPAVALIFLFLFIGYAYSESIINAPSDWVEEGNIRIYDNRIVIYIANASIAGYEDTNSMLPVLDRGSNGIRIVPKSPDDIHVGDIVSYESEWSDQLVVHRVVYAGSDSLGSYYITKGDNNADNDPGRVRFSQIKYITVAIVY